MNGNDTTSAPEIQSAENTMPGLGERWAAGATFCLEHSHALVAALLAARAMEIVAVSRASNLPDDMIRVAVYAGGIDGIVFLRLLFFCMIILPPLILLQESASSRFRRCRPEARGRDTWGGTFPLSAPLALFALTGSLFLILSGGLSQYFATSLVPLGADLYGYTLRDIRTTVAGSGSALSLLSIAVLLVPCGIFWIGLRFPIRINLSWLNKPSRGIVLAVLALSLAIPSRPSATALGSDFSRNLALNKAAYFISESFGHFIESASPAGDATNPGTPGFAYLSPDYPFLRREETPDVLGEYFSITPGDRPPNFVFLIMEGLGRSFSGPDASLGSFTPFLDELAPKSLYFSNFLASQGRTFAVLPSLFGSLPYGLQGFNALEDKMPAHNTLLSLLKRQGYSTSFSIGFDLEFDRQKGFMTKQGVDRMIGLEDFEPKYPRSPGGLKESWGYADGELFDKAFEMQRAQMKEPFIMILQTISLHTPYLVPGQNRFDPIFEKRMQELALSPAQINERRTYRKIFTSLLYVDDVLKRFFEKFARQPEYARTIFIITGDHRLPEIPLASKIDRYHVPLIIFSPLLKRPALIRSVSSHFDVTPSLLAFLSKNYGLKSPRRVTWLGSGLDMEPRFRNIHEFPMKQTTGNLTNFISGTEFLDQSTLFSFDAKLSLEPKKEEARRADLEARFNRFQAANARFAKTLKLIPPDAVDDLISYGDVPRIAAVSETAAASTLAPALSVSTVSYPPIVSRGSTFALTFTAINPPESKDTTVLPIAVILDAGGAQMGETDGKPLHLASGDKSAVRLGVSTSKLSPGTYYLAILLTNPETGKKVGDGKYHQPITIK